MKDTMHILILDRCPGALECSTALERIRAEGTQRRSGALGEHIPRWFCLWKILANLCLKIPLSNYSLLLISLAFSLVVMFLLSLWWWTCWFQENFTRAGFRRWSFFDTYQPRLVFCCLDSLASWHTTNMKTSSSRWPLWTTCWSGSWRQWVRRIMQIKQIVEACVVCSHFGSSY